MTTIEVRHFSDPGCPWAYSARPAHARLRWRFGDQLHWNLVLIGLSEDTSRAQANGYTPERMARGLRSFRDRFGMPFLLQPKARMTYTSRACRANVAVREQDPERADAALRALQRDNRPARRRRRPACRARDRRRDRRRRRDRPHRRASAPRDI